MKLLLLWPNRRVGDWSEFSKDPSSRPEPLDGLGGLEALGFELEVFEVNEFPLNPGARRGSLWAGLDPLRAIRQVVHARRFDAIVCVGDSSAAIYLACARLRSPATPVVLIDPALDEYYRPRIKLQGFVLPRCSYVIVYGSYQLEHLRRRFGDRVKAGFVHHRIDADFYHGRPRQRRAGRPRVLSVGDDQARDFETVCEAARGVEADFIIKSSAFRPRRTPPNVRVVRERVDPVSLRGYYEDADLAIVSARPTIHACGVNSLLESLAMSLPTVVTDNPALADYTRAGSTCALVPAGDVAAMRAAVRALLSDPARAEGIAGNGRDFVESRCSISLYAARIAGVVRSVTERRAQGRPG